MTRKTPNHTSNRQTKLKLKSEVSFYDNDGTYSNLSVTYFPVIEFVLENSCASNVLQHTATNCGQNILPLSVNCGKNPKRSIAPICVNCSVLSKIYFGIYFFWAVYSPLYWHMLFHKISHLILPSLAARIIFLGDNHFTAHILQFAVIDLQNFGLLWNDLQPFLFSWSQAMFLDIFQTLRSVMVPKTHG